MSQVTFEEVYANAYVRQSIEVIIKDTIKKYPMLENQRNDIEQELLIAINSKISIYNSSRGSVEHFFRIVLDNGIRMILRHNFSHRAVFARIATQGGFDESFVIDASYDGFVDSAMHQQLQMDVAITMETLSGIEKEICNLLMAGFSIREVAQTMNISIGTLYRQYLSVIRQRFEEFGFKK